MPLDAIVHVLVIVMELVKQHAMLVVQRLVLVVVELVLVVVVDV